MMIQAYQVVMVFMVFIVLGLCTKRFKQSFCMAITFIGTLVLTQSLWVALTALLKAISVLVT